jgi:riboflavin synthase
MFSGIIIDTGIVRNIEINGTTKRVTIASSISDSLVIDQSLAHDGVCLTVVKVEPGLHQVEVVNETQSKTTFQFLETGKSINLEKSISLSTLLDGHLIQGHVDTTLVCQKVEDLNGSWMFQFNLPEGFETLVIPHGSICINGISLTIANLYDGLFDVAIIPYTYHHTNFKFLKEGDMANVEFDLIGKYILRQLQFCTLTE